MERNAAQLREDLRTQDAVFWEQEGNERTLVLFRNAARRVPAYRDFLYQNNINPDSVKTMDDFRKLPIIDKENYIRAYSLEELCWDGVLHAGSVIATSSGTTGKPSFWPRQYRHELATTMIHDALLRENFQIETYPTLFVVCFHLGAHIAGMVTVSAIRDILTEGAPGALVTPGLNGDDILRITEELGPRFGQVVLIGYPPFLKDIATRAQKQVARWPDMRVRFLFAAEAFTEAWRSYVGSLAHVPAGEHAGYNIYGSADVGLMAHETPLSIALRESIAARLSYDAVSGGDVPAVFQYHPWFRHFDEYHGELLCTGDAGIPLIRYNMKDRGSVIPYAEGIAQVGERAAGWRLPFVTVAGRSNLSVTLYGLNIYPEHVIQALTVEPLLGTVTGKFFLRQHFDEQQDQFVEVHVELHDGIAQHDGILEHLRNHLVGYMRRVNQEYNKLHEAIGDRAAFRVHIYEYRSAAFTSVAAKHKYIVRTS